MRYPFGIAEMGLMHLIPYEGVMSGKNKRGKGRFE
jgi:hypothetical protein